MGTKTFYYRGKAYSMHSLKKKDVTYLVSQKQHTPGPNVDLGQTCMYWIF